MNLFVFAKSGRRHRLFLTTPIISLGASLLLVARLLKGLVHRGLERRHRATARAIDGALAAVLDGTRWFSYLTLAIWIGASFLELTAGAERVLNRGALIVLLVQLGLYGQIAVRRGLEIWQSQKQEGASSQTATAAIGLLARIAIWTMVLLTVLSSLGIEISALVAGLGVGGVAAALAVQSLLGDVFASLSIYVDRPFEIGDFIIVGDDRGSVEHIGWRATRLRQMPNNIVIVPNAKLADMVLKNYEMPGTEQSAVVTMGVAYDSDLERVERIVIEVAREVLQTVEGGVPEFEPLVRFHTFGDSSINFNVILRARHVADRFLPIHEFVKRVKARFDAEGIEIPFPQRVVHLPGAQEKPLEEPKA